MSGSYKISIVKSQDALVRWTVAGILFAFSSTTKQMAEKTGFHRLTIAMIISLAATCFLHTWRFDCILYYDKSFECFSKSARYLFLLLCHQLSCLTNYVFTVVNMCIQYCGGDSCRSRCKVSSLQPFSYIFHFLVCLLLCMKWMHNQNWYIMYVNFSEPCSSYKLLWSLIPKTDTYR